MGRPLIVMNLLFGFAAATAIKNQPGCFPPYSNSEIRAKKTAHDFHASKANDDVAASALAASGEIEIPLVTTRWLDIPSLLERSPAVAHGIQSAT